MKSSSVVTAVLFAAIRASAGMVMATVSASAVEGQQFEPKVANPSFPEGQGPRVLWGAAHFNSHSWDMSAFLSVLPLDGFRLTFQRERWTTAALDSADVIVVAGPLAADRDSMIAKGPDHYWWSEEGRQNALADVEIVALVRRVRAGAGLLVILDHAPQPAAAARLAEALGVEVRNSMTWDDGRRPPEYNYIDNQRASHILFSREQGTIGDHPITRGRDATEKVDRVATYVGSSIMGPLGSTPLLLLSAACGGRPAARTDAVPESSFQTAPAGVL